MAPEMLRIGGMAVAVLSASLQPAYAYVDPGSASIALQAVIGVIAAGAIFFRDKIYRLARFLRRGRVDDGSGDEQDASGRDGR